MMDAIHLAKLIYPTFKCLTCAFTLYDNFNMSMAKYCAKNQTI